MKPGTLIIIGTVVIVMGFIPPISLLSVIPGLTCLIFGISALNEESKEKYNGSESRDKEGSISDS